MKLNKKPNYIDITYDRLIHQTEMAVLLAFDEQEVWIPLSQVDPESLPLDDMGVTVGVEYWLIQENGLEDYEY